LRPVTSEQRSSCGRRCSQHDRSNSNRCGLRVAGSVWRWSEGHGRLCGFLSRMSRVERGAWDGPWVLDGMSRAELRGTEPAVAEETQGGKSLSENGEGFCLGRKGSIGKARGGSRPAAVCDRQATPPAGPSLPNPPHFQTGSWHLWVSGWEDAPN